MESLTRFSGRWKVQQDAVLTPTHTMFDYPAIEVIGRTVVIVQQGGEAIDLVL